MRAQARHLLPEPAGRIQGGAGGGRGTCPQKYLLSALIKPPQLLQHYQWASESEVREAGSPRGCRRQIPNLLCKTGGLPAAFRWGRGGRSLCW